MDNKAQKTRKTTVNAPEETGRSRPSQSPPSGKPMKRGKMEPALPPDSVSSYDSLYEPAITEYGETITGDLREELSRDSQ